MTATTATILRAAANLIEAGDADTAAPAILLAVHAATSPGQPYDADLYTGALAALAGHLAFDTHRNPVNDLRRWSQLRTPAEMAREMRAAADKES